MVQRLGLHASIAGSMGFDPWSGELRAHMLLKLTNKSLCPQSPSISVRLRNYPVAVEKLQHFLSESEPPVSHLTPLLPLDHTHKYLFFFINKSYL